MSFTTENDSLLEIQGIKANDKYIICVVEGYLNEEDKNLSKNQTAIFLFDCTLTPIKMFEVATRKEGYYCIANNCKVIYSANKTT